MNDIHKTQNTSYAPELLDQTIDEDGTEVTELLPLLALDISELAGNVSMGDDEDDPVTADGKGDGGGQISPSTAVAIWTISSCASLAGTYSESCSPEDDFGSSVGGSSAIIVRISLLIQITTLKLLLVRAAT